MALLSAHLAVLVMMPFAFGGTDVANLGAYPADFRREVRLALHERGGGAAELRSPCSGARIRPLQRRRALAGTLRRIDRTVERIARKLRRRIHTDRDP